MAYLDNLTTQVNLTWDQTELEAVQADVEGFDVADFGFDIEDLPQVTFPTGEKQGEGNQSETERLSGIEFSDVYYTPKEKPEIKLSDCIDTTLFDTKMKFVESLDLPREMKDVLKVLAYRFIRIDFENVANYYAFNATDEEKKAIERLRLVLVDGSLGGFIEDRLLRVVEELTPESDG